MYLNSKTKLAFILKPSAKQICSNEKNLMDDFIAFMYFYKLVYGIFKTDIHRNLNLIIFISPMILSTFI